MRITVVTDSTGRVLGTAPVAETDSGPIVTLAAGPDQTLHQLDLPAEFESMESVDALHEALQRHLAS